MNDILFEILRLLVMLAVFVVTYSLLPWIRGKIGQDRLAEITKWVDTAVLMAQQVYQAKTGAERKAIVIITPREHIKPYNAAKCDIAA